MTWFRILRWWHLTWEITSAHKELKRKSSCPRQSWILSYHSQMTPRLNCLLNFGLSFHCVLLSTWFGRVSVWVCHWKWKCPCLFRNFRGWDLLSLSEDSCQNYSVIAVILNALHIYILPAYRSSAHFLVMAFHILPPLNPVYCSCRPFFCNKQFHTLSSDLFLGFLACLIPLRLSSSIWNDSVIKHPYYMPSPL